MDQYYKGLYTSAIARAKRVLMAADIPWSTYTGRYPNHSVSPGIKVARVGCSDKVCIHACGRVPGPRELERQAVEVLRAAGLPFDDRGWLECRTQCYRCGGYHDRAGDRACRKAHAKARIASAAQDVNQ